MKLIKKENIYMQFIQFFTALSLTKLPYSYFIHSRTTKGNSLLEVLPKGVGGGR